jgi:hypothetical protein
VEIDAWATAGLRRERKPKCERKPHRDPLLRGQSVGTDTTDRTGDWEIVPALVGADDQFHAIVDREKVGRGDKKLVCKGADSPELIVEP